MKSAISLLVACFLVLPGSRLDAQTDAGTLAGKARAVLKTHCYRCHGQDGKGKGGLNYLLDTDQLIVRGKVIPGKAAASALYQRVLKGEMPPSGQKPRPGPDDIALLKQWIDAGAPNVPDSVKPRPFLSDADILHLIRTDLQKINPRQRRFARYFTLTHLYNAGRPNADLQSCRHAVAKLINSLSWHPRLGKPQAIDPAATILRIDLRHYKWSAKDWDRLLAVYPYRVSGKNAEAKAIAEATGCELAHLRADWFVATASRPPLYHDLLQLPVFDRTLERLLQVDVLNGIQEETAVRAGFNDSGVAKNNRLIERHDAAFGAYWRSYDFSDHAGRQNIFDHPLGPAPGQNSFEHAGGEIIFNLPNGLQGYLLVDKVGRRIDRAPVEIVSDPKRPDRQVETGLSCMSCHVHGLIPKNDQVRAHVVKNAKAFLKGDVDAVTALYPPEAEFRKLLDRDVDRFVKALGKAGVPTDIAEPISTVTLRYEATLDLAAAAAEVGLAPQEFSKRLSSSVSLSRLLGPLKVKGGTVQRQVFVDAFPELVTEFKLGDGPASVAVVLAPFTGHTGAVRSIALSADGRFALSGGEDRTIRLWEVASGKELRRFQTTTAEVAALAVAPDGQRFLSGGNDRTVRLWDVAKGKELCRFEGHTQRVRCVAFSWDGKYALSGGQDKTVRLWEIASGKELRCFTGHTGTVSSVSFAPNGKRLVSASFDQSVRLWEVASGKELHNFTGHTQEVYAVAFSGDGRRVVSGGNDRTVRLWDAATGKELRCLKGHANAVIGVAFTRDDRTVLSASSRYQSPDKVLRVWDVEKSTQLRALGEEAENVGCVALAPDGRFALTGGSGPALSIYRFATVKGANR
jgi:mono/diheme cytochrome c family protein